MYIGILIKVSLIVVLNHGLITEPQTFYVDIIIQ